MTLESLLPMTIILIVGVLMGSGCVVLGAWVAFRVSRTPGEGAGFLKDPKGEVFSIGDGTRGYDFPGTEEPSKAEKHVLGKTEQVLRAMTGGME